MEERPGSWFAVYGAIVIGLWTIPPSFAADGALDSTFGSGGKVITPFGSRIDDTGRGIAIQKDGKILVAGTSGSGSYYDPTTWSDFALARYNTDGSLDTGFGTGGKVTTDFSDSRGISTDRAYGVAIQSDGKIVVVGSAAGDKDFAVARYSSTGSLDTAFASGGKWTSYSLNTPSYYFSGGSATAVAIQSDGKIVVVGYIYNSPQHVSSNQYDFVVMRFNASGTLDSTFGSGGVKVVPVGSGSDFDYAYAVAIQSDGKIVVAGSTGTYRAGNDNFGLVRLNTNGSLDTGFGTGGIVKTDFVGKDDAAYAVAIQSDGKIVAAGNAVVTSTNISLALARYGTGGALDTGFGSGGKVTTKVADSGNASAIYGLAFQADGKIVAGGVNAVYNSVLARYSTSGVLDATFGSAGLVTTTTYDNIYAVAIQPDGRILTAGQYQFSPSDFGVVRYLGGEVKLSATGQADCIFSWAERSYPSLFAPSGASSATALDYHYRYYSGSNAYLALAGRDSHLYYFGSLSQNTLLDLGLMGTWLSAAGCP